MSVAIRSQKFALVAITFAALGAGAAALGGCNDDKRPTQLPLAPIDVAPDAVSAYLTVSNATPSAGSVVVVSVHARRGVDVGPIGSFTIRLRYDSTLLKFKEAARSTHGMVLTNAAKAGELVAAGASAQGFTDDELVSVTFVASAMGADALKSLTLSVTELNSVKFEDQKANMRVERALYRDARTVK